MVKAFEDVRAGAAPDAILWNKLLSQAFIRRCREFGLPGTDAFLNRRLINIRKNIKRYEQQGYDLSHNKARDPHSSIVQQYAAGVQFVSLWCVSDTASGRRSMTFWKTRIWGIDSRIWLPKSLRIWAVPIFGSVLFTFGKRVISPRARHRESSPWMSANWIRNGAKRRAWLPFKSPTSRRNLG